MAKVFRENPVATVCRAASTTRRRFTKLTLGTEILEERLLLSSSEPFFKFNTVKFGGVAYILTVNGPGVVKTQKCGHQSVSIKLAGTTPECDSSGES